MRILGAMMGGRPHSFADAAAAGIDLRRYDLDCPAGSWVGRLDHAVWGKSANLWCCFTEAETGARYRLSAWQPVPGASVYTPRDGGMDFATAPIGATYRLETGHTRRGGVVWRSAAPVP